VYKKFGAQSRWKGQEPNRLLSGVEQNLCFGQVRLLCAHGEGISACGNEPDSPKKGDGVFRKKCVVNYIISSAAHQQTLNQFSGVASPSRRGNCWNNAPSKSNLGSLKTARVQDARSG
jgi:hypothetical protein